MSGKVFGVELEVLVQRQWTEIPKVVSQTLEYLHVKKAHLEEGLFRIPGNTLKLTQLKKIFDSDSNVDLFKHKDLDVHTVACLLKMYLRELPTPVILPRYYSTYMKVYQNPDPKQRIINFRKLVMGLPKANRFLLTTVLGYLRVVAEHQSVNKMSSLNLALIFAPNLMRSEKETLTSIMEDADKVAGTLQLLIQENEYLATGRTPQWFGNPGSAPLVRTKSVSSPTPLKRENTTSEAELMAVINSVHANEIEATNDSSPSTTSAASVANGSASTDSQTDTINANPVITPPDSAPVHTEHNHLNQENHNQATTCSETTTTTTTTTTSTQLEAETPQAIQTDSITEIPSTELAPPNEEANTEPIDSTDEQSVSSPNIPLRESTIIEPATDPSAISVGLPLPLAQSNTSVASISGAHETEFLPLSESALTELSTFDIHTPPELPTIEEEPTKSEESTPPASPGRPQKSAKKGSRPALTNSLGNEHNTSSKRRLRAFTSFWRSSSDTSLAIGNLKHKQPDQKVIAKSVNSMKLLRASSDLTANDKPHRRRLSLMSERNAKNQGFMSHQQLKSFSVLGKDRFV